MGLLGSLGDNTSGPLGGLFGSLNDPDKFAALAMIMKGLSPYSEVDPTALMKLAQAQKEHAINQQFRQQQLDLSRRAQDRSDEEFGWKKSERENARSADTAVFDMLGGGSSVAQPPPSSGAVPYLPPGASPDLPSDASVPPMPTAPTIGQAPAAAPTVGQAPDEDGGMSREKIMEAFRKYPNMGADSRKMLLGRLDKLEERGKITRAFDERKQLADQLNLPEGSKARQQFLAEGKVSRPEVSATDARMIAKAEDELPVMRSTLENLKEALDLTPQTYEGYTAGARGWFGARAPQLPGGDKTAAIATDRVSQILNSEGIKDMSRTMKGATSDREMKKWLDFAGDMSRPVASREQALRRAISLYENEVQTRETRINQLRGGDYYQSGGGQSRGPAQGGSSVDSLKQKYGLD